MIVLGKPSSPLGPLDVTNIYEDRCDLEWKTPEDDGGMPIDHYEIEKMDLATGRWVPCGRSETTKATVNNLVPGHEYKVDTFYFGNRSLDFKQIWKLLLLDLFFFEKLKSSKNLKADKHSYSFIFKVLQVFHRIKLLVSSI